MTRFLTLGVLAATAGLGLAPQAQAQVFVRAPFVRVQVGGGVYVRAPFVNLFVPPPPFAPAFAPPMFYNPPRYSYSQPSQQYVQPGTVFVVPAPRIVDTTPAQVVEPQPQPEPPQPDAPVAPKPVAPKVEAPPQPAQPEAAPSLEQFASKFQPKGGNYEVTIVNPVTGQPTAVRFTLPEGNPRRVHVRRNEIEFEYGIRRFVRIEFDTEGALVTSR